MQLYWFLAWLVITEKMTAEQADRVGSYLRGFREPQGIYEAVTALATACMSAGVEYPG